MIYVHFPWRLWLDDDAKKPEMEAFRRPPEGEDDWKVARNTPEAHQLIDKFGLPWFIDFDHDLGLDIYDRPDTAIEFLRQLQQENPTAIESIVGYRIHSRNPEGAKNIKAFLESWRKSIEW